MIDNVMSYASGLGARDVTLAITTRAHADPTYVWSARVMVPGRVETRAEAMQGLQSGYHRPEPVCFEESNGETWEKAVASLRDRLRVRLSKIADEHEQKAREARARLNESEGTG